MRTSILAAAQTFLIFCLVAADARIHRRHAAFTTSKLYTKNASKEQQGQVRCASRPRA
jgi:hypothetical protein